MSALYIFPVEVLERVTSMITTVDQVHLWQCGSRVLSAKLKQGGLKVTSLQWTSSSWMPWPRSFFATFTGIQEVDWGTPTGASICPTLEINLLPKTLLDLQIDCDDIYCLLRKQNANLNEMFPLLRTIYITGTRIQEENLKNLPENLIALTMASHTESLTSGNLFRDLPRTLEVLELWFNVTDTEEHGNDLPNGLKEFVISGVEASYDWLIKLPHSLTKLAISTESNVDWSRLPPSLTDLSIDYPTRIVTSMLHQFPQSLKRLDGWFEPAITDEDMALLPKTLVSLSSLSSKVTHVGLQQLPVTVNSLTVDVSATHPEILSFYNPESSSIRLKTGPCLRDLKLFPLPLKLYSLEIDYVNDDICALLPPELGYFEVLEGLITAKGAAKFPKSIASFMANFGVFDNNETIAYLSFIPRLTLIANDKTPVSGLDENWISYLRPATKLPNSASSVVTPNFTYLPAGVKEDDEDHRLTDLRITCQEFEFTDRYLTGSVFESLPRFVHLETLTLAFWRGTLPSSCLRFIPENVTHLDIGLFLDFPTAEELAMLPKRLKRLSIELRNGTPHDSYASGGIASQWTDEVLQALPRTLQVLTTNGSHPKLTARMNQFAPPYLREMRVAYYDFKHFEMPMDRIYGKDPTQPEDESDDDTSISRDELDLDEVDPLDGEDFHI